MSLEGKQIGNYVVSDRIASGGMGSIYLVTKVDEGTPAIMKIIRQDLQEKPDFRKRFLREIRILAELEHENIIPIYDWGYKRKTLYYIMKKVDGPTVRQLIDSEYFTPEKARNILAQLADALDYTHSQGVMHRDVKPGNVLLEKRGDQWHVYLMDFGLGKNPERDKTLPMIDRSMGTVEYMSPELVAEEAEVDYRVDVYSLASIAYEMLLGIKPHKVQKNPDGTVQQVLLLPSMVSDQFPYPLEAVLAQGMDADRNRRFQSARAFMDAYDHALAQLNEAQCDTSYQFINKHLAPNQ